MVKNVIIMMLILVLAVIFVKELAGNERIIDREFQEEKAVDRAKSVKKAHDYELTMVIGTDNYTAKESLTGFKEAIKLINDKGGIKEKKLLLNVYYTDGTKPKYLANIVKYCTKLNNIVCLGPYISGFAPSARSLMQFYAMPLVSPMTVYSDTLPKLDPEIYVSYFPELKIWVEEIIKKMHNNQVKNVLLISPKQQSYGSLIATAFHAYSNAHNAFSTVHRVNFTSPLNIGSIQSSFVGLEAIDSLDAIFFSGDYNDYVILKNFLKRINFTKPIYATEDINVENITHDDYKGGLIFPVLEIKQFNEDFRASYLKTYGKKTNFNVELSAKIIFDISTYLNTKDYQPFTFTKFLAKSAHDFYQNKDNYSITFKDNYKHLQELKYQEEHYIKTSDDFYEALIFK